MQVFSYLLIGYLVREIRDTLVSSVSKVSETYLEKMTLEAETRQKEYDEAEQADPAEIRELTPEEELNLKLNPKDIGDK